MTLRQYSDFWLRGGVLSAAWTNRPDEPEVAEHADQGTSLEAIPMGIWLRLPEAARQAVVADYTGPRRNRMRKAAAKRPSG